MKITGGNLRGRNVESRPHKSLRPTTGRVREAIFNMLIHGRFLNNENFVSDGKHLIEGRKVLDIFCGTGILGIEAFSRGAEHVTLVDEDSRTIEITKQNVRNLGVNANILRSDSTKLPRATHKCSLVFMDPPYNSNLANDSLKSLKEQNWLEDKAIIILEHGIKEVIQPPEGYTILDEREYNKTQIMLLQYRELRTEI